MSLVFVIHEPFLFEEFIVPKTCFSHPERTPRKIAMMEELLKTLGDARRVNLTMWILKTELPAATVSERVLSAFQKESGPDGIGDLFVLNASDFCGYFSSEGCQAIQEVIGKEYLQVETRDDDGQVKKSVDISGGSRSLPTFERARMAFRASLVIQRCRFCGHPAMHGADVCYTCNTK